MGAGEVGFGWLETPPPMGGMGAGREGTEPGGGGVWFLIMSWKETIVVNNCYLSHLFFHFWGCREHPQTERKSQETEGPWLWLR